MELAGLIDLVFPVACAGCGAAGAPFCKRCEPPAGAAVTFAVGPIACAAVGPYAGTLRAAILGLKAGRRDVADALAALIVARLRTRFAAAAVLVGVPTTGNRRRERGFDQGPLLARSIARRLCMPSLDALACRDAGAQHERGRRERLAAAGR
ncbi:MAG: ComF family protein, partial [Vulcanimicrobiaceae bacterium]